MTAKIYHLSPKGSAWLVYYRKWAGGGCTTYWSFVFDYDTGLTAHEAWKAAILVGNPAFYEVITLQLDSYPSTGKPDLKFEKANGIKRKAPKGKPNDV